MDWRSLPVLDRTLKKADRFPNSQVHILSPNPLIMAIQLQNIIFLSIAFLSLFGLAEYLYHRKNVQVEKTRKLVHFGTGILTLLFPLVLESQWEVLFLCSSFIGILVASLKFNLLPSINAIERKSYGSIAFPIAVYLSFLLYQYMLPFTLNTTEALSYFYLPILILAICDPIAALGGKRFPLGRFKIGEGHKTLMGSSLFFLSAAILLAFALFAKGENLVAEQTLVQLFVVALSGTMAEAISGKGWDNLTIPLAVSGSYICMEKMKHITQLIIYYL